VYTASMVREILERQGDIATLCRALGVERLYAFGSATTFASVSQAGDLDFLVQFRSMPPVQYAHNYFDLAEKLESLFQKPVDLVEMETLDNPYFKEAVDETKVPVYESA